MTYAARRAGETPLPLAIAVDGDGVRYTDAFHNAVMRDIDSVLWQATGPAAGPPVHGDPLHPGRQRDAMEHLWCAECGRPPGRSGKGVPWVLAAPTPAPTWEGVYAEVPPICETCIDRVLSTCPSLRAGHVVLRVHEAPVVGYRGTLYPRPQQTGQPEADTFVSLISDDCRYLIATSLVRQLFGCAVITTHHP
ncbi:hypothetical protein ABZ663_32310 [Streptomyces albidoflavus]|uniref:hypothetical protein n=1 Tax=Streptomyces albidoflavus TaxID=1886 RepID=UPI003401D1F0